MSEKNRRKKDGHEKSHDLQAMREGNEFKKREAHVVRHARYETDEVDHVNYKKGSAGDESMRGAR